MIVVRGVQPGDVDALADEAELYEAGYLFVMENTATGDIAGVCGIETEVGLEQPFYNYRVSTVVHASRDLGVWTKMSLLNISHYLTGYAEVYSLFLSPRYRTAGVGGLLSRSRCMFIAQFRERFPERLCAELRGHFDESGASLFWQAVGSYFYQIDFNATDYLSSHGKKSFLAELMPRYLAYLAMLPEDVQAAVGLTHRDTMPARKMLETEGLRYENHVDIFDAGPVLECHITDLCTVRVGGRAEHGEARSLVSNTSLDDFRCGATFGMPEDGFFLLTPEEAAA
ncbi:MAG: Arginine N-succinyltransferase, beta subunit (EC [uncultured Caballeronia sp.]|nr:MAG: Arginine N-succinyltransferase, beta subunit (EC [uncultured Caballeronia sp.]